MLGGSGETRVDVGVVTGTGTGTAKDGLVVVSCDGGDGVVCLESRAGHDTNTLRGLG